MKNLRIRISNGVDVTKTFSASIRGGARGYEDACAVESHSNDVSPTIKTIEGFTVIVEMNEEKNDRQEHPDSRHNTDR